MFTRPILVKLSCYGIGHELLEWIRSFLTSRTQRVIVDNVLSEPIVVGSGVVQGSVLGPLVFILFINDIVDCLDKNEVNSTSCCIFADDLKLYSSNESTMPNNSLTNTITNIENWSRLWQLAINPDKSLLLQVGNGHLDRQKYLICNTLIPPSTHIRDLGILYNSKLCFHDYIDEIVGKAYQRINLLFRSFVSGNVCILTRAYITYVRPLLEYCSFIWSPYQICYIEKSKVSRDTLLVGF